MERLVRGARVAPVPREKSIPQNVKTRLGAGSYGFFCWQQTFASTHRLVSNNEKANEIKEGRFHGA